jgi:hypothetical protein
VSSARRRRIDDVESRSHRSSSSRRRWYTCHARRRVCRATVGVHPRKTPGAGVVVPAGMGCSESK